jgi:hypothetical protein
MNLAGKTLDQIERALARQSRLELLRIIFSLSTLEELFSAAEIAARTKMNVRDVRRDINAGKMGGGYFCRSENSKKVSASGVNQWRASFFVPVTINHEKNGS